MMSGECWCDGAWVYERREERVCELRAAAGAEAVVADPQGDGGGAQRQRAAARQARGKFRFVHHDLGTSGVDARRDVAGVTIDKAEHSCPGCPGHVRDHAPVAAGAPDQ